MAKHVNCQGNLIRFYREQRGWTQLQLATRSGFSERLIRKVEDGGRVREQTLAALAQALSGDKDALTAADLSADPTAVAQAFIRGYLRFGAEAARRCAHLFHPDVVMAVHTDPNNLAFGGEFVGVEGIGQMISTANAQFESVSEDFGKWYSNGTRVAAVRQQVLRARNNPNSPHLCTWLFHECNVIAGRIERIDTYLDAAVYLRLLEFQVP